MLAFEDSLISPNDLPEERHEEWLAEWRNEDNEMLGRLVPIPTLCLWLEVPIPDLEIDGELHGNFHLMEVDGVQHLHSSELSRFLEALGFARRKRLRLERELEEMIQQADQAETNPNPRNPFHRGGGGNNDKKRKRCIEPEPFSPSMEEVNFDSSEIDQEEEEEERPQRTRRRINLDEAAQVLAQLETTARIIDNTSANVNLGNELANMAMQVARRCFGTLIPHPSAERSRRIRMMERIHELGYFDQLPEPEERTRIALIRIGKEAARLHQLCYGRPPPRIYEGPQGSGTYWYDAETAPHTLDPAIRTILASYDDEFEYSEVTPPGSPQL